MGRGRGDHHPHDDQILLPPIFDTKPVLTNLQNVQDTSGGVYVCIECSLEHDDNRVLFFDDKPSAITHKQDTGHTNRWYHKTVYKPFRDGFIHPGIIDAARKLDPDIDTAKLINGTRDPRRDHR